MDGRDDGESVTLELTCRGQPIPPAALPSLFEAFRRVPTTASTGDGLGLGLYIAKQIVTAHGGTIGVQSTASAGTTFLVRLPRRQP